MLVDSLIDFIPLMLPVCLLTCLVHLHVCSLEQSCRDLWRNHCEYLLLLCFYRRLWLLLRKQNNLMLVGRNKLPAYCKLSASERARRRLLISMISKLNSDGLRMFVYAITTTDGDDRRRRRHQPLPGR